LGKATRDPYTDRAEASQVARRDVGRAWEALAACGLVVVPETAVPSDNRGGCRPVEKLTAKQRADREERLYKRGLLPASECRYFIAPKACDETERRDPT